MPKLLQISVTCNHGSTGRIAEQVGLMMQQRGWDVYLAHSARFANPSRLNTYRIQSKLGEYVHLAGSILLDADGLGSVLATKRLVRYIKALQPDVIQLHNIHGYYLNYKILFEYIDSTDIPVVMTLHDCWTFTGHCVHFEPLGCSRWQTGCFDCPLQKQRPKLSFIDRSRRNFALKKELFSACRNLHVVCVSEWLTALARRSFLNIHPILTIHNGIDLEAYKPMPVKPSGRFRILGIANPWSRDKGLYDVFRLREMLPLDEYNFMLVGLRKNQLEKLPHGISGMMRTSNQQELVKLYSESDVVINLTYADSFPTINLEAMACGTPVITYRTGGSPESLDSKTGIILEPGDVDGVCMAIRRLKQHNLSFLDCRRRTEELFNKDERFLDYVQLYESMVGARIVSLPKIEDPRGNLTVIEQFNHIPFEIKRVFMVSDIQGKDLCCKGEAFVVVLKGSLDAEVQTAGGKKLTTLDKLYQGLYIPKGTDAVIRARDVSTLLLLTNGNDPGSGCLPLHEAVDFPVKRVFYTYEVPDGEDRGAHAHKECHQYIVAAQGAFDVTLDDGSKKHTIRLSCPGEGIHIPPGVWASEENYTKGSICLVLASQEYNESDYIRNYTEFLKYTNNIR